MQSGVRSRPSVRRQRSDSPHPQQVNSGYGATNYDLSALENGHGTVVYREDTHKYNHGPSYYEYWFSGWDWWRCLTVLNFLIGAAALVIVIIILVNNNGNYYKRTPETIPTGQRLEFVNGAVKLPPGKRPVKTKSYKFNLNGVYARYPADGGVITGLGQQSKGTAEFCCNYQAKTGGKTVTKQACASTTSELQYRIELDGKTAGGYMIVSAQKSMVGAQCTLTWTIQK